MLPPTKTSRRDRREKPAEERRSRRLAVRAGDGDDRVVYEARRKLYLSYHLRPVLPRLLKQGVVTRHAGAYHDQPVVEEVLLRVAPEPAPERDAVEGGDRARKLFFPPSRPWQSPFCRGGPGASPQRRRLPQGPRRGRGLVYVCRLSSLPYLSFSVLMARSPSIIDMIQKRTTIFSSFQPFSSKWW